MRVIDVCVVRRARRHVDEDAADRLALLSGSVMPSSSFKKMLASATGSGEMKLLPHHGGHALELAFAPAGRWSTKITQPVAPALCAENGPRRDASTQRRPRSTRASSAPLPLIFAISLVEERAQSSWVTGGGRFEQTKTI